MLSYSKYVLAKLYAPSVTCNVIFICRAVSPFKKLLFHMINSCRDYANCLRSIITLSLTRLVTKTAMLMGKVLLTLLIVSYCVLFCSHLCFILSSALVFSCVNSF